MGEERIATQLTVRIQSEEGDIGTATALKLDARRGVLEQGRPSKRTGDLKHAYDGVQQWAVEVVLMRMRVPDEYAQYQSKLTV